MIALGPYTTAIDVSVDSHFVLVICVCMLVKLWNGNEACTVLFKKKKSKNGIDEKSGEKCDVVCLMEPCSVNNKFGWVSIGPKFVALCFDRS